jgi:hypothetical protein
MKKFPHPVLYGPERAQRLGTTAMGVVFERDHQAGDEIAGPIGARVSPENPFTHVVSGVATVFAQSSRGGARVQDHECEADRVAHGVICAMFKACKMAHLPFALVDYRLVEAKDLNGCETWPGAIAVIRFRVTTLVRDVDYLGDGDLTGVVADVHAPLVQSPNLPDYDPVG